MSVGPRSFAVRHRSLQHQPSHKMPMASFLEKEDSLLAAFHKMRGVSKSTTRQTTCARTHYHEPTGRHPMIAHILQQQIDILDVLMQAARAPT
jgi:hypothetical protein